MKHKNKESNINDTIPFPEFKDPISCLGKLLYTQKAFEEKTKEIEKYNRHQAGRITLIRLMKLLDLMDAYGIKKTNGDTMWMALAYKLAEKHEPSFQIEKAPRGRPSKWDTFSLFGIYCIIEFVKFNNTITDDSHACKTAISKILKYTKINISQKTLQNKYAESKSKSNPFIYFVKNAKTEDQRKELIMYGMHTYLDSLKEKSSQ
ncbi:hypothetical protein [Acinetobacter guerrae]|uniref:hypothetical protein n=1 Tax=Acinetobacter guerrae TaxID=1843371 RepID=UPI00128D21CE|nr:hypothetical protein [Acinetobacter guerrae]MPW44082.1 hypothetical protein [Acinetobacter guerrae]